MQPRVRRRRDGLPEIAPIGRAEATTRRVGLLVAALPAAAVALLAIVAVLPVAALAIPPVLVGVAAFGAWSVRERWRGRAPH